MSSKLARNPVVSLSAIFAMVALAFSSGCAGDLESLDEESEFEPSFAMREVTPEMMKRSCKDREMVWEGSVCRKLCDEGYELVRGICTSKRHLEPSKKYPGASHPGGTPEDPTEDPGKCPTKDPHEDPTKDPIKDPTKCPHEGPNEDPIKDPNDKPKCEIHWPTGPGEDPEGEPVPSEGCL
jgi:hypothetical protein